MTGKIGAPGTIGSSSAISGPDDYFNDAYAKTLPAVTRFVIAKCGRILDTEDILQNIYAKFYQRIVRKGWQDIENTEAFLINLAKFETRNFFGSLKKRKSVDFFSDFSDERMVEVEAELSRPQKGLEDTLLDEMTAKKIFEDIANDDPEIGKIFYMHFVLDMKLNDIADELDLGLSAVKNKLYRTIERQKKRFAI